jgi:ergothioneine biosynthesis protein EgtB
MSAIARALETRRATMRLVAPLSPEDCVVQSMPDASPVKWHLAHTTWFFERFVLAPLGIPAISDEINAKRETYDYLFNSYYESVGPRHPRARRGLLTRPSLDEVLAYRRAVDARLADLEGSNLEPIADALELGKNHEEQHQELILTDLKHLFAQNALLPMYAASAGTNQSAFPLSWRSFDGGLVSLGATASGFSFDNERPQHKTFLAPFEIASRAVTCGEYRAFIEDGGYRRPELWLSDGWAFIQAQSARAPLYWGDGTIFTLNGERAIEDAEPVCHVTYYEADAYARWAEARLPTEAEWEVAANARSADSDGAFVEDATFHPRAAKGGLAQMLGDVWEWTSSAYSPYPGFAPLEGAFAEYNGKFMVSQLVLRGGSCATPRSHVRTTYRNFFPPTAQWQFSGIRLARNT